MAPRAKSYAWLAAAEDQQDKADDGQIKAPPSAGVHVVGFVAFSPPLAICTRWRLHKKHQANSQIMRRRPSRTLFWRRGRESS